MISLSFPEMFNGVRSYTYKDHEATATNLKLLLASDRGSLFGDPYYGTNLKRFLYSPNDVILKDLVIDEIYTSIITFMPQLKLSRKDITVTSDKTNVYVTIKAVNILNYEVDLYNINLTDTDEI
jgi:phage baseplate assembly protein W